LDRKGIEEGFFLKELLSNTVGLFQKGRKILKTLYYFGILYVGPKGPGVGPFQVFALIFAIKIEGF